MSPLPPSRSRAELALRQAPCPPLRKLAVEETAIRVTISGSVFSYYHKQLAQEAIMPHLGNRQLVNQVRVLAPASEDSGQWAVGGGQ